MIAIINYGLGNLGSIENMLDVIGERSIITGDKGEIDKADKMILPGVGAYDAGMKNLEDHDLVDFIKEQALGGKPVLGICLGMQLLGRGSEEGTLPGLGLIPFDNKRFDFDRKPRAEMFPDASTEDYDRSLLKIPHMGWDVVEFRKNVPLLDGIEGRQRYYFVHSYHAVCDSMDNVMMTCDYGYEFAAAVCKDNIYGVQFHPEKSHDFGMKILENFAKKC